MKVDWSNFKSFVTDRNLSIQWLEINNYYFMEALDNGFVIKCDLDKSPTDNTELNDFETNFKSNGNKPIFNLISPFSSKMLGSKKLYKRIHGISSVCSVGSNNILYEITYDWVKLTSVEIINCEIGDTASFEILDKAINPIYGIPNAVLNQFGFDVNMTHNLYEHKSEFDADLYADLQIKIIYTSISAKTIRCNLIMNEVK